jgi:hypothetical protein
MIDDSPEAARDIAQIQMIAAQFDDKLATDRA